MPARKKSRKIRKFKAVEFKLTVQQKKRVDAFCKKYKTTPVTMYKIAIQTFLSKNGYGTLPKQSTHDISANQMSIFDVVEES
ncbi:MAG: hypothetical protein RBS07_11690 [Lentimicrobium sp.]|jgi:hypothetical protein|nr:hypothetical protein [Lentimicrobium sp.]